jgi:hypothetical protein
MCCSVTPGVRVGFSDTLLYAGEALAGGELVHVLGYRNTVQGRVGVSALGVLVTRWRSGPPPANAMLLPFPAAPGTMTAANVVDTRACPRVLEDLADSVGESTVSLTFSARGPATLVPRVQVFEADVYTVVLARDARDIPSALHRVPEAKRPALNPELFEAYARWYPGWAVALCCFNTRAARRARPLLWWYRPLSPDLLFLPGLDGHTGGVPDLSAEVAVDHTLAVGSHLLVDEWPVEYRDRVPQSVAQYLPASVIGKRHAKRKRNGDFVCDVRDVRRGKFKPQRIAPPELETRSTPEVARRA